MATYFVGDIQGCYESFMALLQEIQWSDQDRLWILGDLVNRGPASDLVLKWVLENQKQVQMILGNHDLYLLGYEGKGTLYYKDTIHDFFEKENAYEYTAFLRKQPLVYQSQDQHHPFLLVHAGFHPTWSVDEILDRAKEAEQVIQSKNGLQMLADLKNRNFSERWVESVTFFTRVRMLKPNLEIFEKYKGPPSQADQTLGLEPWFVQRRRLQPNDPHHVYFGHWAALGLILDPPYYCLDTGCIWGRTLTALRLEDHRIFQVQSVEFGQILETKDLFTKENQGSWKEN